MECILGQAMDEDGNGEEENTRTIDVLLQNYRERAKQGLLKRGQGRWSTMYNESVHASVSSSTRRPRTHRINAEMLSKIY